MKRRNVKDKCLKLLETFPALAIIGSRQSGKTSLAKSLKSDWHYVDLERTETFEQINNDPSHFFSRYPENIIIDEAQESNELFRVLRGVIDQNREKKGRFILTGSSSPLLLDNITETLAGRIGIIELGTFKYNEYSESPISPLYKIFESENIKNVITDDTFDNNPILNFWYQGTFPELSILKDAYSKELWIENYIDTYINRDIRKLFPRLNFERFQKFLNLLLKQSGSIINCNDLAQLIEVSTPTIKDYIDKVDKTFLWRKMPPFEHNIKKEVSKMPKGHIRDVGILHHLLKIASLEDLETHPILGRSFESFVIEEIIKGVQSTKATGLSFHYYRTRSKNEIDLVIHGKFGIIPIEIKYGQRVQQKQLQTLKNFINDHQLQFGLLVNTSNKIEWIAPSILQIPVAFT